MMGITIVIQCSNAALGVGKSTLLRHISMREVPIPAHITILFVEQEVCELVRYSWIFANSI